MSPNGLGLQSMHSHIPAVYAPVPCIICTINRFLNGLVSLWDNWTMSIIPIDRHKVHSDLFRTVPTQETYFTLTEHRTQISVHKTFWEYSPRTLEHFKIQVTRF